MPLSGGAGSHWAIGPARRLLDAGGHEGIGASRRVICWNEFGIRFRGLDSCVTRGQEGYSWVSTCRSRGGGRFRWGRRAGGVGCRGLLGRVCPKRRGLKPRLPGCLQETRRWAGVFVVFPVCSRCAFGVVLHGARADLLRFGHLARSLRRAGTRVRAVRRAGLGRGARGCLDLVVDGGLRRQREFKADHEGRGLVIGDEVGVEGGSHRRRLDPPPLPASATEASRARPTMHPALDP